MPDTNNAEIPPAAPEPEGGGTGGGRAKRGRGSASRGGRGRGGRSKSSTAKAGGGHASGEATASTTPAIGKMQMLISYVPGEETRVAVVEATGAANGRGKGDHGPGWRLEEYHAERAGHVSRVGNIYRGIVANVEQSIQAAFIDFGFEQHGFLHVTDVHPKYFPGEDDETTESVGKKTPRRDRPPIQRCLRRGDEVLVQVLKDGVGSKGPTVTSYLSIPGRFLVMMPQMDRVGVSRKVEDEEMRREMRAILDQLELPEGFGFILRTAGMDRTKTELKRDLAYLQRLWKDMEAKRAAAPGNKPALLYSESDLLVRALRDLLVPEIEEVIIDHEAALKRASGFLKIVAPRSKSKLLQHTGKFPLFYSFGVEQQIAGIHAREVPLPSGGRLVIDETEALVAIDVNSGKARDASDAEMNAYKTNIEAVDEICRQLKLRDLGGIVINDLIDMRHASHRKDIEHRMNERLKRDRARTTTLPISQFGILEMTRQRMRGSQETQNFSECPTCRGRGLVQRPESVSGDALRELLVLLAHERVSKVELVVAPRIAGELLSSRRRELGRIERASGKHIDVRVSETLPVDRVSFYVYDGQGADIELDKLPRVRPPKELKVWDDAGDWAAEAEPLAAEPDAVEEIADATPHPIEIDEPLEVEGDDDNRPMRERIREQSHARPQPQSRAGADRHPRGPEHQDRGRDQRGESDGPQDGRDERRRRRRRRGRGGGGDRADAPSLPGAAHGSREQGASDEGAEPFEASNAQDALGPADRHQGGELGGEPGSHDGLPGEGGRRRRRRRRRRGRGGGGGGPQDASQVQQGHPAPHDAGPDSPELVMDDNTPRGDSWDVEPSALPRLERSERAEAPAGDRDAEVNDIAGEDLDEPRTGNENGERSVSDTQPDGEGEPRRRRRRRRGRGGRGGGGGGGGDGQGGGHGQGQARQGGGAPRDQHRGDSRQAPPRQGPAPEPKAPAAPGIPNFLYSSRRRLAPGEVPKQRRE